MVTSNVYILQAMIRRDSTNGLDCFGLDGEVLLKIFAQQDGWARFLNIRHNLEFNVKIVIRS